MNSIVFFFLAGLEDLDGRKILQPGLWRRLDDECATDGHGWQRWPLPMTKINSR